MWRTFSSVAYFSKYGAIFYVYHIFPSVAHFTNCFVFFTSVAHFSKVAAFIQLCLCFSSVCQFSKCGTSFASVAHFSKCGAVFQVGRIFPSLVHFAKPSEQWYGRFWSSSPTSFSDLKSSPDRLRRRVILTNFGSISSNLGDIFPSWGLS